MFGELYDYTIQKCDLYLKFNALIAIKIFLDTIQYPIILIVQVYFIEALQQIAAYKVEYPEKKRGLDYFINLRYQKTSQQAKKLGYNYVRLASQIFTVFSIIKSNKLYKTQELYEESVFAKIFRFMKIKKWKQYDYLEFYNTDSQMKKRQIYLEKLEKFKKMLPYYYSFLQNWLLKHLKTQKRQKKLYPIKILQFTQVFACNFIIKILNSLIINNKAHILIKILKLYTDFVKWGYIKASYCIQIQKVFHSILNLDTLKYIQIQNGQQHPLIMKQSFYNNLIGTQQQKMSLTQELIKSLQIWTICIPKKPNKHFIIIIYFILLQICHQQFEF